MKGRRKDDERRLPGGLPEEWRGWRVWRGHLFYNGCEMYDPKSSRPFMVVGVPDSDDGWDKAARYLRRVYRRRAFVESVTRAVASMVDIQRQVK
ncbi:MAG: hypothetical protein LUE27_00375 [Clostridia bacterium]|nr:hypothetical protein [Clostridia bacterium]